MTPVPHLPANPSLNLRRLLCVLAPLMACASAATCRAQQPTPNTGAEDIAAVEQAFRSPPEDARIRMRWWWFGPAVVDQELEREILAMKQGGIGGFEIQPVYPLALDDAGTGFRNLPYLSDAFLKAVHFAAETAHSNGMRVDMTLASGWPYGGPQVPVDQAAGRLRVVTAALPAEADSLPMPSLEHGESLIATFAGSGTTTQYDPAALQRVEREPVNGRMSFAPQASAQVVLFFVASRTGQQVKRAAVNAEGFVLDHYSRTAVDNHLHTVADRLMTAFGETPPYSVFSDSLEVYGADWTPDLLTEFQRRRGYDLTPYLPQLARGSDETSAEVRHDWGVTLTELIDEHYLTPIDDWAKAHGTRFRSQTYGTPAVSLSSNRLVALPEGEGPQWNQFSYTRWATSASHLYGRPITSAETWTWLHSPAFRATPLDMKAEADRFFLEGVNQLVGHGWPYTPPGVPEPGWSFYAAAVFDDHNPWWIVMPDVTKYLQRVSYLLRQGKPANDVAVLLPNDDAYAAFTPGKVSLSDAMPRFVTPELMQQILGAGHNVDFIDSEAIERQGIPYSLLVLPHVERLSPETLKSIAAYVAKGGKVIAVGSTPAKAPGLARAAEVAAEVKKLSDTLFADHANARVIAADAALGAAVAELTPAALQLSAGKTEVGFIQRRLDDADVFFVANTSNHPVSATATFRTRHLHAATLDATTGATHGLASGPISLELAPYESRIFVFSDQPSGASVVPVQAASTLVADLSQNWTVRFAGATASHIEATLHSWTSDRGTRFFSGVATYSKTIHLSSADLAGHGVLTLDFGQGTPVEADPKIRSGMRALLDGPIREAAVITINGRRAGSVWRPPYTLEVTGLLHAGDNQITIEVANTAINELSGRAPANYHLLNSRYGERFTPQDTANMQPLPSGLLGPIHLMGSR